MAHDAGQGDHSEGPGPTGDEEGADNPHTHAAGGYGVGPGQDEPSDAGSGYPGGAYPGDDHPGDEYPGDEYPDATYAGQAYPGGAYDPTSGYPVMGYEAGAGGYPPGYDPGEAYRRQAYEAYRDDYQVPEDGGWQEGPEYGYTAYEPVPPSRRRGNGPWPELVMVTAVAVVIAAVALAVTTANRDRSSTSAPPATTGSTLPAPSTTSGPTTTTVPPTTSTSSPSATTAPPAGAHAVNLTASPAVKASLVKSWLASDPGGVGLVAKDVAGTVKGQVYYADQPHLGTYWALAAFQPAKRVTQEAATAAGQAELSQFQDNVYVFSSHDSSAWTVLGVVSTGACPGDWVPKTVLAIWGLCGLRPPAG